MRRLWACACALLLPGCTQDFGIFEPDGSVQLDGGPDADTGDAAADAASDSGPAADASNDAPGDSGGDAGVDAAPSTAFTCPVDGGVVTSCSDCAGYAEPCVFCNNGDASVEEANCQQQGKACNAPGGYGECSCSSSATCPASYQVCSGGRCQTCGEGGGTNGKACQGGGTCNGGTGACN